MIEHSIYILAGETKGPVFINVTSALEPCLRRHRSGKVSHMQFRIDRLVYTESYACSFKADARLRALKSGSREWLDALISSKNPAWQDLLPAPIKISQAA